LLLQSCVTALGDNPVRRANSTRETLWAVSHSVSFMPQMMGAASIARKTAPSLFCAPISPAMNLP
jgi:hypothetical protein